MFVCVLIWLVDNNTVVAFHVVESYLISRKEVKHFITNSTFWVCEMVEEPGNEFTIVRLLTQHTIVRL